MQKLFEEGRTIQQVTDILKVSYPVNRIGRSSVSRYRQQIREEERIKFGMNLHSQLSKQLYSVKQDLELSVEELCDGLHLNKIQKARNKKYFDLVFSEINFIIQNCESVHLEETKKVMKILNWIQIEYANFVLNFLHKYLPKENKDHIMRSFQQQSNQILNDGKETICG